MGIYSIRLHYTQKKLNSSFFDKKFLDKEFFIKICNLAYFWYKERAKSYKNHRHDFFVKRLEKAIYSDSFLSLDDLEYTVWRLQDKSPFYISKNYLIL